MKSLQAIFNPLVLLIMFSLALGGCNDEDVPAPENEEEAITDITLTFTPVNGGEAVEFSSLDPDGQGSQGAVNVSEPLAAGVTYTLSIEMFGPNGEDISAEVEEEGDEHMIFFEWNGNIFSVPAGNGNIDTLEENAVIYEDEDENGLPLGLTTTWTIGEAGATGSFRMVLKHQPGIKSATSTSAMGTTDADVSWNNITVVE